MGEAQVIDCLEEPLLSCLPRIRILSSFETEVERRSVEDVQKVGVLASRGPRVWLRRAMAGVMVGLGGPPSADVDEQWFLLQIGRL